MAKWLGIPEYLAEAIVHGQCLFGQYQVYPKNLKFENIKPKHVIRVLTDLLEHGPSYFLVSKEAN